MTQNTASVRSVTWIRSRAHAAAERRKRIWSSNFRMIFHDNLIAAFNFENLERHKKQREE